MNFWTGSILNLKDDDVFVFGSNPEGRHGMGAAKTAMKYGAKYGVGRGLQGNTYALVTKNLKAGFVEKSTGIVYNKVGEKSVSECLIMDNIREMYAVARKLPSRRFFITYQRNSKLLNGYGSIRMFRLFNLAGSIPDNIYFHGSLRYLNLNLRD